MCIIKQFSCTLLSRVHPHIRDHKKHLTKSIFLPNSIATARYTIENNAPGKEIPT